MEIIDRTGQRSAYVDRIVTYLLRGKDLDSNDQEHPVRPHVYHAQNPLTP